MSKYLYSKTEKNRAKEAIKNRLNFAGAIYGRFRIAVAKVRYQKRLLSQQSTTGRCGRGPLSQKNRVLIKYKPTKP